MKKFEEFILQNQERYQSILFDLLRIPSVSADPKYSQHIFKTANQLQQLFTELGFASEIISTTGNPLVYAETPPTPSGKVLLFYGHYDVQPVDPLELWKTPPFEPTVRDGNVYARGATDDKGQFLTHVFAGEAILKNRETGTLPVQLKFLIEGEEESLGSLSLSELLKCEEVRKKWASDCLIVSDSSMFGENQPAITCGLRGIVAFELELTGPNRDLHSGDFGGTLFNPGIALSKMLSQLIDSDGRVQVPGFYDDVRSLMELERDAMNSLPFEEQQFFSKIGVSESFGEVGYTTLERRWVRPTFDINGMTCGYQGEGSKTIIPSRASAKFTFRLVPNQKPEEIARNLETFLRSHLPPGIQMSLKCEHGAAGMIVPLESPYIQTASRVLEETFGVKPVFTRQGGSIPIVSELCEKLETEVLLIGWGQDDDNLHAPNEKFSLTNYQRGILASARFIDAIAGQV
ncbi:MAG: dipeptidase [Thermoguttaceae bacterium]